MQRQDVVEILGLIPEQDIYRTCLALRFGATITIDSVLRFEEEYCVMRGREAGTNDDCRLFFMPYEELIYIKIDRVIVPSEVRRMYGEKVTDAEIAENSPGKTLVDAKPVDAKGSITTTPAPAPAMDPAGIAKQNLLARIRAARTSTGASAS